MCCVLLLDSSSFRASINTSLRRSTAKTALTSAKFAGRTRVTTTAKAVRSDAQRVSAQEIARSASGTEVQLGLWITLCTRSAKDNKDYKDRDCVPNDLPARVMLAQEIARSASGTEVQLGLWITLCTRSAKDNKDYKDRDCVPNDLPARVMLAQEIST